MIDERPIPGIPGYLATRNGEIISTLGLSLGLQLSRHVKRIWIDPDGYEQVSVRLPNRKNPKRFAVHRLIAFAFLGLPARGVNIVCHYNGNKRDNRPENLRWGTEADNALDKVRLGESRGLRNGRTKITPIIAEAIRAYYRGGKHSQQEIAGIFKLGQSHVSRIIRNETWC